MTVAPYEAGTQSPLMNLVEQMMEESVAPYAVGKKRETFSAVVLLL